MAYLFDVLDFLPGSRLTGAWYISDRQWPDDLDVVLLGQFLELPPGQHVTVESDFLSSHLPFRRGGFDGVFADGEPWLFVVQAAPASLLERIFDGRSRYIRRCDV